MNATDATSERPVLLLDVTVTGEPAPQGSKRNVGNGVMVEASQRLPDWRRTVAMQVNAAMRKAGVHTVPNHSPVRLSLTFILHRPQRPVNARHVTKPDLDKLLRAVMDALVVGALLADDAQVFAVNLLKRYAAADEADGVRIQVWWPA